MMRLLIPAWRSLRGEELAWFVLLGLAIGVVNVSVLQEVHPDRQVADLLAQLLSPLIFSGALMAVWLPVERQPGSAPMRLRRLVGVCLLGTPLAIGVMGLVMWTSGWPAATDILFESPAAPATDPISRWGRLLGDSLAMLWSGSLTVAVLEVIRRRRGTEAALTAFLAEQASLRRQAMAARLAARQAQLEPKFLFEALSAIEQAYARRDPQAAPRMDALIHHLRVALPRLNREGVTLEMEMELLQSWLAAAAPPGQSPPRLVLLADTALCQRQLPPMLLLPLLQQAYAQSLAGGQPALQAVLAAQADRAGWRVELRLDQTGLPPLPADVMRPLGERLAALCGARARLSARRDGSATRYLLELPT